MKGEIAFAHRVVCMIELNKKVQFHSTHKMHLCLLFFGLQVRRPNFTAQHTAFNLFKNKMNPQ